MNGARVARSSHEEALSLVRRIPTVKSAWVYARPVGNLRWRAAKRCWAELRGNTLLLHVVGEQSSRANPEHLARRTASENVMMINLKDSRIRSDTKKNRIRIKRSSGENSIELKLKDTAETKKWHSALPVNMTKTFCGTREYIAPEMLNGSEYGQSVDLWAFGILLYEILCGRTPFYSRNREEVYTKIENGPLRFPRNLSAEVISLIRGLLDRNPNTRLGLGPQGISEIKQHDFFHDMDWEALFQKEDHPDNIVVERNPIGIVEEHSSSSKSDPEKLKSSKNPVNEIDMAGKEADMLLEDESQEEKKRPDVFALFVSTKKKAANIAGYSYAAVPQPPPNAAVHESSQLLR
ncbi:unnamed protein product [Agarophyton chilense]